VSTVRPASNDIAWIEVVEEDESQGALADVYREVAGRRGKVANIMKVHSLNPAAMKAHMDLYLTLLFGSSKLPRATRELVAVVVSRTNGCDYCARHHAEALNHYWKDEQRVELTLRDFRAAGLPEWENAMLEYAVKLTASPGEMDRTDIETLRRAGLDDSEILDLNLIVNYFNFVNRIALGLGVSDSTSEVQGYVY
jgi:uncharacterized peroxidase-related enzyme